MSELLTLPPGDPQAGFVAAPREGGFSEVGLRPPEEQDHIDERIAALEADTARVLEAENAIALERIAEAEAAAGLLAVSCLIPNWVSISLDEPVLLHVHGQNFTETTQIWWHDHLETTVFVSDTEVTTWVCPWLFLNPDQIFVGVQDGGIDSNRLYFGLLP